MQEEKPRLARLTAIITDLQSTNLITASILAKKYQVSVRTIYRDIRTLQQSGIPIVTEEGKGYSLTQGYKLPPVMLTEDEANALITAQRIIAQNLDSSLIEQYNNAITKIKAILKTTQKSKADLLTQRVWYHKYNAQNKTSNYLMLLQTALTNFNVLKIEYLSLAEQRSERRVEPFALFNTQENWLLIAFCQLRNDFRVFRVDRIQKLEITTTLFAPHKMTLEEFFKKY